MLISKFILHWLLKVSLLLCTFNLAYAGEPPVEPILRLDLGEHSASINGIAIDKTGSYLVTASNDKTARVWNLADGKLLRTLRIPIGSGSEGMLYAVALSPDGQTVALAGYSKLGEAAGHNIFLFDRASGNLLRRFSGLPNVILGLAFSADGNILAATLHDGKGLRLFSVADGRLLAEDRDYGDASYFVHFNPASAPGFTQLVTSSDDGYLRLYHFDGQQLKLQVKRSALGGKEPQSAIFSPDGHRIAVGFRDTLAVNIVDAVNLSPLLGLEATEGKGDLRHVTWSPKGDFLYAAGRSMSYTFHQVYIRRFSTHGKAKFKDFTVGDDLIAGLAALPNGQVVFANSSAAWGIVSQNGIHPVSHPSVVADFRGDIADFTLSSDGYRVRFNYTYDKKFSAAFDSRVRGFLPAKTVGLASPRLAVSGINVTDWENAYSPTLNGIPLKLAQGERSRCLALLSDGSGFALGTEFYLRLFNRDGTQRWRYSPPSIVYAVNISQDGRWVVAAYGDGTIRWHRASDGAEQLAFFPHADKKRWGLWTPSGYYDASPGAENMIGWHVNNGKDHEADFFPASRFRDRFYRPDVLAKVLGTQDEAEAVRQANNESGRRTQGVTAIAQVLPPVVEIVSPAGDSTVQPGTIKVRYRVRTAADAPVTAMRVRVNGLLQSDTRALKRIAENDEDVKEIEVTIPEGGIQSATRALKRVGQSKVSAGDAAPSAQEVEIQLFAENKFSTSTPSILRLQLAGGKASTKQVASTKPKLYVLAVGVSKYANPEYNLGLASKDANDFVNSMKWQKGKMYSDVAVKLLTDAQATKDDVLDGLDWLKQNVTANDVGVMFVAGHGMNDKLGGYYFMPHNADLDKLARTGVSQSEIKQTFANLPGHTVFFIDTCYSGGVMGNVRTSGFLNDLASAENGAVVFTASSAGQLSQENSAWGNGAFTKSVVEGLNGKADAFNSGVVTAKGLDFYVDGRVKSLTKGQQTPVSIAPGGLSDFPLAGVGR